MKTAKLFQHGGSQAVRLPKEFRFAGNEVRIERRGKEVVLRPLDRLGLRTFGEVARHLRQKYAGAAEFPDIERPKRQQKRDLAW